MGEVSGLLDRVAQAARGRGDPLHGRRLAGRPSTLGIATVGPALDHAYVERWVRDLDLANEWAAAKTSEI